MIDDALAVSVAAYRTETSGMARDADGIKRRVLIGLGARQRRRLRVLRFAFPVAAVFFASMALAASKGAFPRLDDVREWLGVGTEGRPLPFEGAPARRVRSSVQTSPQSVTPLIARPVAPLISRPDTNVPPRPASQTPARAASLRDVPVRKTLPAPVSRADPLRAELRAYQTAHRLHFDGGDPATTLAAWDAYLQGHPAGTFVAEARFNRAVCLLRLGRRTEARSMLVPIAESSSAYGRRRARALLDAMGE